MKTTTMEKKWNQLLELESSYEEVWEMPKATFILVSGLAGVGKTTFAYKIIDEFKEERPDYIVVKGAFAMGVKAIAKVMGWDRQKDEKGRQLLQDIGNTGRKYDEDTWVKYFHKYVEKNYVFVPDVVVVDDWRFPNEAEYIKNLGLYDVITIRVEAPEREMLKGTPQYFDISETSLSLDDKYDYIINNIGSLNMLDLSAENIVQDILKEK